MRSEPVLAKPPACSIKYAMGKHCSNNATGKDLVMALQVLLQPATVAILL